MGNGILSVGDAIESRCTKCRVVTKHIIVSMMEGAVAKVRCNVCEGVHNYHRILPGGATTTKKPLKKAKPAGLRKTPGATLQDWEKLMAKTASQKRVPYNMSGSFRTDDLIEHPKFGLGVVRHTIKPNKMEVLFQEGPKLLRCAL
jgi:hypothetical protein